MRISIFMKHILKFKTVTKYDIKAERPIRPVFYHIYQTHSWNVSLSDILTHLMQIIFQHETHNDIIKKDVQFWMDFSFFRNDL